MGLKFTWKKISALNGNTEAHYVMVDAPRPEDPFTVIADQYGVRTRGNSPYLTDPTDFSDYAKCIGSAAKEFKQLQRAFHESLTGASGLVGVGDGPGPS